MKKKFTTLVALLLCFAMALSLAACGKVENGDSNTQPEETPEFVYTSSFKTLSHGQDSIYPICYTDEGFYLIKNEVVGQREPEEGEVAAYEGQFDIYDQRLYFMDYEGVLTLMQDYVPAKPDTDHETFNNVNRAVVTDDGIIVLEDIYESWSDAPEGVEMYTDEWYQYYQYKETYLVRVLDKAGVEKSRFVLNPDNNEYFWPGSLTYADGKLLVSNETTLYVYDLEGNLLGQSDTQHYMDSLVTTRDGRVGFASSGDSYRFCVVDPNTLNIVQEFPCPNAWSMQAGSGDYDLYYTNGMNFFGYDLTTGTATKLFNWVNVDVDNNNINGVYVTDDGTVLSVYNEWDSNYNNCETQLIRVEKKPYDAVPHKESIKLAGIYIDGNVKSAIIKFNRQSNVRIEPVDYSEYNTDTDYTAGLTKLTTEILAGQMPDILYLEQLPASQIAGKGLLEDLYPYLDSDSELSREALLENVLKACEYNGALYCTCSGFNIRTLCGAAPIVGDAPGWTYQEFEQALASMPEGCRPLTAYTTSGDILRAGLSLDIGKYVDWGTGETHFDSQEFIDLLHFADRFPDSFDWNDYNWEEETNAISQGRQMLMEAYLGSFDDLYSYDVYFGGNMTYIGYPSTTGEGTGALLNLTDGYAMSASCRHKDAAWSFLRNLFTAEYQEQNRWYGFPTNRECFDKRLEEAMTPMYETDENGNPRLDENGNKIEMSRGGWSDGINEVQYYALTQEQADKILAVALHTTVRDTTNEQYAQSSGSGSMGSVGNIYDVVSTEADAFFLGQKSAEEVARLVQTKANLYVNEQR